MFSILVLINDLKLPFIREAIFFFETEVKALPYRLIKQKRVPRLIYRKPDKNRHKHAHTRETTPQQKSHKD
jgi:hypothetical protein